jgi:regulator of RNase E activity RraA
MTTELTTAHLADACLRAGVPVRVGGLTPVTPGSRVSGRVRPARHAGSVDVFLEAIDLAEPGDVLVVDNGGRLDEACVGDLVVLEAMAAGLAGVVVWGLHRDTADIRAIGLPVFSLGALPTGPLRLDARAGDALRRAQVGPWSVDQDSLVVADDDGAVFLPAERGGELFEAAARIRDTERAQAARIRGGESLRAQLDHPRFLAERERRPEWTFRDHLRTIGGAIEE